MSHNMIFYLIIPLHLHIIQNSVPQPHHRFSLYLRCNMQTGSVKGSGYLMRATDTLPRKKHRDT